MSTAIRFWDEPVGRQADGSPWQIRFVEIMGSESGPATAFISGMYGDKPMGCLAVHELQSRLTGSTLKGRVILIPAANPPAFGTGTRLSPDHLEFNRRFPGQPDGFLTDQLTHHISRKLFDLCDCIVDLQPGTPLINRSYIADYGDREFTASFGYLPVIIDRPFEGQLSKVAEARGLRSSLAEWGGGPDTNLSVGVEGALNVLRYRGQLGGKTTGPKKVPLIKRVRMFHPSTAGILQYRVSAAEVGTPVSKGLLGWVASIATGEHLEEFVLDEDGAVLLLASNTPATCAAGDRGLMVGFPFAEIEVPQS